MCTSNSYAKASILYVATSIWPTEMLYSCGSHQSSRWSKIKQKTVLQMTLFIFGPYCRFIHMHITIRIMLKALHADRSDLCFHKQMRNSERYQSCYFCVTLFDPGTSHCNSKEERITVITAEWVSKRGDTTESHTSTIILTSPAIPSCLLLVTFQLLVISRRRMAVTLNDVTEVSSDHVPRRPSTL